MSVFSHEEFDHEQVVFCSDPSTGLKAIIAIHNTNLGPAIGGCRMVPYATGDDALTDVLRLAKGMTYKCAVAGIPFGGGKAVIIGHPQRDKSQSLLHAMGAFVDTLGGRYITSFDAGTTLDDVATMGARTRYVGGIKPGAGNASQSTALGVYKCMKRSVDIALDGRPLSELTVAIQGAGNVGGRLAALLAADGARIHIADSDSARANAIAEKTNSTAIPAIPTENSIGRQLAKKQSASHAQLMLDWLKLLFFLVSDLMKPRAVLQAEITALRQQVITLKRRAPRQLTLRRSDRLFFTLLYRFFPEVRRTIQIVQPDTLVRWHRMGFRALWRWKSRPRGGRPVVSREIRDLIREISLANPLWGAPRIHGELKMLGIGIAQSTVAKYIIKRRGPPSQTWKTFIRNHGDGIAACDFLVVPTVGFKMLFVFIVMAHGRRKLLQIGVTAHPTAEWTARQITEAFPWDQAPDRLIRDNDAIYGATFKWKLNSTGIRDGPAALKSPWQNGYVERVIGSIRRECLDHIIIRDADHLRRILKAYTRYYNSARTHLSLQKNSPAPRKRRDCGRICFRPHLGGLHHEYARIQFPVMTMHLTEVV